jgi:hypothetical protein
LRLPLDTSDPVQRHRVEQMFSAAFQLRRAVQQDARHRCRAYHAASREQARSPAATRDRLGLSRSALEDAAYAHVDAAPHLRRHVTKALAMHLADGVWTAAERHLFRDASGKTFGIPKVGRWFEFTRLPGRARLHSRERKWETFRLVGTLDGHRAAYTGTDGRFFQPRRMRQVAARDWWTYKGPLAVVFTGLADGTLVLPVRLPSAPANQPTLDHHLADASRWHKVDLVRSCDPSAPGGWRYDAHVLVLTTPYASPSTIARRQTAAIATADRRAGIDVNVSNVTVASHADGADLQITRLAREPEQTARDHKRSHRERLRLRALERSRRAMNRAQYQLSKRQEKRARRLAERGLPPPHVIPAGPRIARADDRPLQAYRRDQLSRSYRQMRAAHVADAASTAHARRDRARWIAASVVADHGYQLVVEDTNISAWARSWGRAVSAFSPGMLVTAIDREATAIAQIAGGQGGLVRASTHTTAWSQHCLCGQPVLKWLGDRVHACGACGLRGDRDAVAATIGAFVGFGFRGEPASAFVDYDAAGTALANPATYAALRGTLDVRKQGRQDVPSESNARSAREGAFLAWTTATPDSLVVARRIVGTASRPTPDETSPCGATTLERARRRTNMSSSCVPSSHAWWDISYWLTP